MKPRLKVSFSGGKTSGYMTKRILDEYSDKYDITVIFANTGQENEATLKFVHDCDTHFGFNTVWVEAVVNHGVRKSSGFKVVNYETASRNGEPFEEGCKKYGVPNMTFLWCTRELKLNAMYSYMDSIGWEKGSYDTAIGIRMDEKRRVSVNADVGKIVYPLIDWFPSDKQDVNDFWEDQDFTLELLEHQGNCKWCYKKSDKKLYRLAQENPEIFDFPMRMEDQYGYCGARKEGMTEQRVIFRRHRDTRMLLAEAKIMNLPHRVEEMSRLESDLDGGCSESCEIYPTEVPTEGKIYRIQESLPLEDEVEDYDEDY